MADIEGLPETVHEAWARAVSASRWAGDTDLPVPNGESLESRARVAGMDAAVSLALSNAVLASVALVGQTPAVASSAPGEREYDPGRAVSTHNIASAPIGTLGRDNDDTQWIVIGHRDNGEAIWRIVTNIPHPTATLAALISFGLRITDLPTPVGQTPAGPVAAVATGTLPDLTPAVVEEARRRYTATYTAEVDDAARSTDAMRAGLGDVLDWYRVEIAKHGVAAPTPAARPALSADSPVGTVALIKPRRWVRCSDNPDHDTVWRRTTDPEGAGEWVTFEWLAERGAVVWTDGETPVARSPWEDCTHTVGDNGRCFECGAPTAFTLFESGYLPDSEIDAAIRESSGYNTFGTTIEVPAEQRDRIRRLFDDLMTRAAAYCERTPEIRRVPAPFVRGVDELTDDELNAAVREAHNLPDSATIGDTSRQSTRRLYDALTARLRVDGPRREADPDEITVTMLDAAEVGAKVNSPVWESTWRKCDQGRWDFGVQCRSSGWLVDQRGPLSNLRPPSEPETTPTASPTPDADDTRRALVVAVLLATAGRIEDELELPQGVPLTMARSDVDAAAREHVAALDPSSVVTPFALSVSDDDIEAAFNAAAKSGVREPRPLRDFVRGALQTYAERLANRATGGYDPATCAPGTVIVAGSRVYLARNPIGFAGNQGHRWVAAPFRNGFLWSRDEEVPTDGVLVVDGATLGGGQ